MTIANISLHLVGERSVLTLLHALIAPLTAGNHFNDEFAGNRPLVNFIGPDGSGKSTGIKLRSEATRAMRLLTHVC